MPSLDIPELGALLVSDKSKDLFEEKKRKAWKDVQQAEARCDFAPNKVRISYRSSTKSLGSAKNPQFGIVSLWKKSLYGRTLTDIKSDDAMVEKFADGVSNLIGQMLGHSSVLATGAS